MRHVRAARPGASRYGRRAARAAFAPARPFPPTPCENAVFAPGHPLGPDPRWHGPCKHLLQGPAPDCSMPAGHHRNGGAAWDGSEFTPEPGRRKNAVMCPASSFEPRTRPRPLRGYLRLSTAGNVTRYRRSRSAAGRRSPEAGSGALQHGSSPSSESARARETGFVLSGRGPLVRRADSVVLELEALRGYSSSWAIHAQHPPAPPCPSG